MSTTSQGWSALLLTSCGFVCNFTSAYGYLWFEPICESRELLAIGKRQTKNLQKRTKDTSAKAIYLVRKKRIFTAFSLEGHINVTSLWIVKMQSYSCVNSSEVR